MPLSSFRAMLRDAIPPLLLALALPAAAAAAPGTTAAGGAAPRYKFDIPPSADIGYTVIAKQSGFPLEGQANVTWRASPGRFSLDTEMRAALFGKIIEAKTEGVIDRFGLAPLAFTEKRIRKDTTVATFDRARNTIRFKNASATFPITGGEQDRNSAIWQLIAVARAAPARFKPGSEWRFFVVGQNDASPWIFKVVGREKIKTALGELNTVHLLKTTAGNHQRQRIEIWLAPALEWYPARLRYTDPDGDYIEQKVVSVTKKTQ